MRTQTKTCALLLSAGMGLAGILGGCDRKVMETTKTSDGPNGSTVEKKTVIQHDDGTVSQEKEVHTTQNP